MRNYAIVSPTFWTGPTGRAIRALGPEAQIVALYLITCPTSTMIGLYYMPLPTLCHETGCSIEGASKALRSLGDVGFCHYDDAVEHVWIPEMAKWQIGDSLDPRDKRVKAVHRAAKSLLNSPFFNAFLERYGQAFHLADVKESPRGIEAPSMPHRSQEQEQEQEHDHEQDVKNICSERLSPPALPSATNPSELINDPAKKRTRKEPSTKKHTTHGDGAVVITIPLVDGTEAPVTEDKVVGWEKTYPAVDVRQQLGEMREWSIAHPRHRKTPSGAYAFVTGWLGRAQNRARAYGRAGERRDRTGAPLPPPRKTEIRDRKDGDQIIREEYDTETGQIIRSSPRKNPKGGKS